MPSLLVLGALFLGALAHATLGFGTALVAMPVLVLALGARTAAPVVALVMVTSIALLLWKTHRHVHVASVWRLLLAAVVGAPVGVVLLRGAPPSVVHALLGVLLIGFSLHQLARPGVTLLHSDRWSWLFGFFAGALGVAYNTNGPPMVLYGTLRGWDPDRFRATLQGFFLPAGVIILATHAVSGMWTREVLGLYLWALPPTVAAFLAGTWLSGRIPAERFERLLYVAAGLLGVLLLV